MKKNCEKDGVSMGFAEFILGVLKLLLKAAILYLIVISPILLLKCILLIKEFLQGKLAKPSETLHEVQEEKNEPENVRAIDEHQDESLLLHPEFEFFLRRHSVKYLVHFTKARNLNNIFTFGLYSRSKLNRLDIAYAPSDNDRFDGNYDAICTSLSFPNHQMFYKKRMQNLDVDWAVLFIDAQILTVRNAFFYPSNAARHDSTKGGMSDIMDFESMFFNEELRTKQRIPPWYSTDPQAEVQILDQVPIDYIKAVAFENKRTAMRYEDIIPPDVDIMCGDFYFNCRRDMDYFASPIA